MTDSPEEIIGQFDVTRFEYLAEKAKDPNEALTDAERAELRAYTQLLGEAVKSLNEALVPVVNEMAQAMGDVVRAFGEAFVEANRKGGGDSDD